MTEVPPAVVAALDAVLDEAQADVTARGVACVFAGSGTTGWSPTEELPGRWHVHVTGELTDDGQAVILIGQARRGAGIRLGLERVRRIETPGR